MNWFFRDRLLTTWNDSLNLQQNSSWSEEKCEANVWVVPGQYCWFLAFSRAFRSWLVPFCISLAPCDICLSSDWLLRLLQLYKNSLYTTRMRRKTEAADYDCKLYKRRVTRFFRDYILTEFFRFFLVVTNFAEICTMGKFWALSASSKFFSRSAVRIFELEELLESWWTTKTNSAWSKSCQCCLVFTCSGLWTKECLIAGTCVSLAPKYPIIPRGCTGCSLVLHHTSWDSQMFMNFWEITSFVVENFLFRQCVKVTNSILIRSLPYSIKS